VESPDLDPGVAAWPDMLIAPVSGSVNTELLVVSADGRAPKKGLIKRWFGGSGAATRPLPWSGFSLEQIWAFGEHLLVKCSGENADRVALLDRRSLAAVYDSGPIPDGVAPGVRLGPGFVAYAFGDSNGPKTLRMVDASGRRLWERTFDDLDDVAFQGGHLTLRTDGGPIEILDIASGQTRGKFFR
jgi:hypothetical protein